MNLIISLIMYGSLGCGMQPYPPFGCYSDDAVCICDSNGQCEWTWICGR